ncbi:MAG: dihydrodipicolinate synthase family protein [Flavihumibacter sp.]|nr:dihydrodipicolinate synthase family protein [Flavihumibacter sp.]
MSEKKFVPVMITPFTDNLEIDYNALAGLIEFYLAAGVKGLFANCLSSEMFSITSAERLQLTQFIVKQVNGRVPVVATGSFGSTLTDKAAFIKQIYDTGVSGVILITSHFAAPADTDGQLLKNIETLLQQTGTIPLGLYECPAPYKRILSPQVFAQLMKTGRFIYHKDTCLDVAQIKLKLQQLPANTAMEFYDAHTPNAVQSIQAGARGMSSISGNFYPEIMVWMCDNAANPAMQDAVHWLQQQLNKADPLIHQAYPLSAKYFLHKRGLPVRIISRTAVLDLTPEQQLILDEIHTNFYLWCEKLNIKPVSVQ